MSLSDARITQLIAAQSSFGAKAAMMRSTIGRAEKEALSAQAFHVGKSATAFQGAHARFVDAAGTYVAANADAGDMAGYARALQNLSADLVSE